MGVCSLSCSKILKLQIRKQGDREGARRKTPRLALSAEFFLAPSNRGPLFQDNILKELR